MPQQHEQQAQTNQILPVTHGSTEPLTFAHQWDSLRLDTRYSDLQAGVHPEVEEVADSQVEEVVDSQVEEVVDSQVEEVADSQEEEEEDSPVEEILEDTYLSQETHKEDHQETDSSATPPSFITETPRGQKSSWRHGNSTKELTEGRPKWTTCINDPCFFSHIFRDLQPRNGSILSATGLNKQFKFRTSTIDDCGTILKKRSNKSLEIRYPKNEPSQN